MRQIVKADKLMGVFYVPFKKRGGVYFCFFVFLTWQHTTASFLNGFKISDIDELILTLIFRFGITLA